ncbi:YciI family protein [Amycolatopsis sp. WAC 04197]|uniref:YciI family protein n=1 Tax=Amycolatopsis sp. WAC 04197 TaxID=2203199 RepID=UPI001F1881BB|nr:YciI family protein [Amycolatopsis sp. WAC 04197]
MEFFCYHRDRPGSMALCEELSEEHWSYMDRYAAEMIARGPTLAGEAATGSVHIVDLPDPGAARAFAFDEPNYQAGVYRDVQLRRWRNTLGRTMWDFPGGRTGGNRYLVLGLGTRRPDPEPVRRHRGPRLAVRRAAVMNRGFRVSPTTAKRTTGMPWGPRRHGHRPDRDGPDPDSRQDFRVHRRARSPVECRHQHIPPIGPFPEPLVGSGQGLRRQPFWQHP